MDRLVYLHRRNDTNAIFYVGMGTMKRAKCHCGRNKLWNRIVKKYGYTVQIICKNLTSQEAKLIERILIKKYKEMGMDLCNFTDGGDGINGWIPSQEWKDNIRKMMMGNSYGLGKPVREPIIGINLNDGSTIKFIGKKSIENDGRFVARQVYRCASRDNICEAYSKGIYKGFQFFWESEYLRKVGT